MFSLATYVILVPAALVLSALAGFLIYLAVRYAPVIGRIFEEAPVFHPLRVSPLNEGEEVRFPTADGLSLAGTYLPAKTETRAGVVVFCHEFLGDRWSVEPYADGLRALGFDLFTFDFRNHGDSDADPSYEPLQWVSDLEVLDLGAALAYLRGRADSDPAGVGLFGVSRGGGAALCVAADDPGIWGVVTDGAFPTRGTMMAYIARWAEIYVRSMTFWRRMPNWVYTFVGWAGRMRTQWLRGRVYCDIERAVSRLAPRPWLMIHGERDNYIGPDIARALFAEAQAPKELWLVPKAKHNRCREVDPDAYRARVAGFFRKWAPRRLSDEPAAFEVAVAPPRGVKPTAVVAGEIAASVSS